MCLEKCLFLSVKIKFYKFNLMKKLYFCAALAVFWQMPAAAQAPSLNPNGIVSILNESGFAGTGFFTGPHTAATALHNLTDITGDINKSVFLLHPKTGEKVFFDYIRYIDFKNDVALVDILEYESPFYYDLNEIQETPLPSSKAGSSYVLGILEGELIQLEGSAPYMYSKGSPLLQRISYTSLQNIEGLSGSPVFSETGQVIGVVNSYERGVSLIGPKIQVVKEMLDRPSMRCTSSQCIQDAGLALSEDRAAQFRLGLYEFNRALAYQPGQNEQDRREMIRNQIGVAAHWLQKSSSQNYPPAALELAKIYFYGMGAFEVDYQKFEKLAAQSAKEGFAPAQHLLGLFLTHKKGQSESAAYWFKAAAKQGYFGDLKPLLLAYVGEEKSPLTALLKELAQIGHPGAKTGLSFHLFTGDGVEKDVEEARRLLLSAAAEKNPQAVFSLAEFYEGGLYGFPKDAQRALEFRKKAEQLGWPLDERENDGKMMRYMRGFKLRSNRIFRTCRGWLNYSLR